MLNSSNVLTQKLFTSSRVYRKKLDEDYWVLFAPDKVGMPVVVSECVNGILDKFTNGSTIKEFISCYYGNRSNLTEDPSVLMDKVFFLIRKEFIRTTPDSGSYPVCDFPDFNKIKFLIFWIHITNDCNLCCEYCFVNKTNVVMSDSTIERVAKSIVHTIKLYNIEGVVLKFAGGEPTLALDKIKRFKCLLLSYLDGFKVYVRINILSNGTLVSDDLVAFLKEENTSIGISLDGYGELGHDIYRKFKNDKTGSWKVISDNIDKLLNFGISPYIMGTISGASAESLTSLATWVVNNKLSTRLSIVKGETECSKLDNVTIEQKHQKYIKTLIHSFERMFCELENDKYIINVGEQMYLCDLNFNIPSFTTCCGIGTNHIVINEVGKLANCPMTVNEAKIDIEDDLLLGIRKTVNFSPKLRGNEDHPCLSCRWFPVCSGGCPIYNNEIYNDYMNCSVFHDFYRYIIPRYIDFFGKKLIQNKNRNSKFLNQSQHSKTAWNLCDFDD